MERIYAGSIESAQPAAEQTGSKGFVVGADVLWKLGAYVVAGLLAYGAFNARLSVTEDRVTSMRADIVEMKADIKALLARKP
jgi:hypothetical protein